MSTTTVRRAAFFILFAAFAGVNAWAAERATFVLTTGEHKNGIVVAHGSQGNNLIDGYFNLLEGDREQTYPQEQVVVIDFAGGTPASSELQNLPSNQSHMLVLRSGATQEGTLDNIVNGDVVVWRNQSGQQQRYAVRDVSRIYLNAQAARTAYKYTPASQGRTTPTPAQSAQIVPAGSIGVDAKTSWTDTGIDIRRGDRIVFRASGQVQFSPDPAHFSGPDGNPAVPNSGLSVPIMGVGGLIGKIGNAQPFAIGNNKKAFTFQQSGRLMLGVNDTDMSDNSGFFAVAIQKPRQFFSR